MTELQIFNAAEAAWWLLVAAIVAFITIPPHAAVPRRILATALAVFGISDIIEIQTGSWWHPWWLFLLKAVCVIAIIASATTLYRRWPHSKTAPQNHHPD